MRPPLRPRCAAGGSQGASERAAPAAGAAPRAGPGRSGTARDGHGASCCHPGNTGGREWREEAPPRPGEPLTCPPRAAPSAHPRASPPGLACLRRRVAERSPFRAPPSSAVLRCACRARGGNAGKESGVSMEFLGTLFGGRRKLVRTRVPRNACRSIRR